MDRVQYHQVTMTTGVQTTGAAIYIDKYDQLMVRIPKVVGFFSTASVAITLKASIDSSGTPVQMNYFDYVNKTPASSVITVTTGGIYELPYPGAANYVSLSFSDVTSNVSAIQLIAPKTTY